MNASVIIDRPSLSTGSCVVFIIAFFVFFNNVGGDFLTWDDTWLIKENPYLKGLTGENLHRVFLDLSPRTRQILGAEYLPVRDLSWMIDYSLCGLRPAGYHFVNNLLHAGNAVLIFLLIAGLFRNRLPAFAAALLFAVHPVHVEGVSWLSARKEVLFSFFFLSSLLIFLRALDGGKRRFLWLTFSLLFFILSLFSKGTAVTLPLILILLLIILSREKVCYFWTIPYFFCTFGVSWLFYHIASYRVLTGAPENLAVRLMTALKILGLYMIDLLWPLRLSPLYHVRHVLSPLNTAFILSLLICLVLFIISLKRFPQSRVYIFACGWIILLLLPVLNIIPIAILKADRYLYLPSAGFFTALSFFLFAIMPRMKKSLFRQPHTLFLICIFVVLVPLCLMTLKRNRIFQDDLTLWQNAVNVSPDHPKALFNLAKQYEKLAEKDPSYQEAMVEAYRKTYELDPDYLEARYNLAVRVHEAGKFDEAFRELSEILRRWPSGVESLSLSEWDPDARVARLDILNQLGVLQMEKGNYEDSIPFFEEGLARDNEHTGLLNNSAYALLRLGKYSEAEPLLERSLKADPSLGETYFLAGQMHLSRAEYGAAETRFLEVLMYAPRHIGACNNLGLIYLEVRKDYLKAVSFFKRSLRNDPNQPRATEILRMIRIAENYLSGESN